MLRPDDPAMSLERRHFLRLSIAAGLGATFGRARPALAAPVRAVGPDHAALARGIIHIHLPGGLAAQESFDPRPDAPIEFRGEIKSIKTALPGVRLSALLPKTAKLLDRLTLVRADGSGEIP